MKRLYRWLRSIYSNEPFWPMALPTRMDFGPEDPTLAEKRDRARREMNWHGTGAPDIEKLDQPYGA